MAEASGVGLVDAATRDDRILWLAQNGAERFQLFDRSQGFEAWFDYSGDYPAHPGKRVRVSRP
ncbi:hypothetical protein M1D93_00790 [Arthrobacter sp. Z1-9]